MIEIVAIILGCVICLMLGIFVGAVLMNRIWERQYAEIKAIHDNSVTELLKIIGDLRRPTFTKVD